MEKKQYAEEFEARVAIEAIKGEKTANERAGHYGVYPMQIYDSVD